VKAVAVENVDKRIAAGTHYASQQYTAQLPAIPAPGSGDELSVKQHVDPGTAIRLRYDVLVHPSGGGASDDVAQECRSPGR
jgi:hypothetical protein